MKSDLHHLVYYLIVTISSVFIMAGCATLGEYQPSSVNEIKNYCYPGNQKQTDAFFQGSGIPIAEYSNPTQPAVFPSIFQNDPPIQREAVFPDEKTKQFAREISKLGIIVAAKYNKSTQELILIGPECDGQYCLDPDDFFVAMRAANKREEPAVTIDPTGDPSTMVVKHFGGIENTHFGFITYAADLFLKVVGFEHDNFSREPIQVKLDNFKSELDLSMESERPSNKETWHRFWIEPSIRRVHWDKDKSTVGFEVIPHVKTENFGEDYSEEANKTADAYAHYFTEKYEQIMPQYPVFIRLAQLFYLDTLVKWFIDQGFPVEKSWLDYIPAQTDCETSIPAVTVFRRSVNNNFIGVMGIYGGVSFNINNDYKAYHGEKDGSPDAIFEEALSQRNEQSVSSSIEGVESWQYLRKEVKCRVISFRFQNTTNLMPLYNWSAPKPEYIPSVQWQWVPRSKPSNGEIEFRNTASSPLTLTFAKTAYSLTIPVGQSVKQSLPPGRYDFVVTTYGARPLTSSITLAPNHKISVDLFIRKENYLNDLSSVGKRGGEK